jgi:hypothetical protein
MAVQGLFMKWNVLGEIRLSPVRLRRMKWDGPAVHPYLVSIALNNGDGESASSLALRSAATVAIGSRRLSGYIA